VAYHPSQTCITINTGIDNHLVGKSRGQIFCPDQGPNPSLPVVITMSYKDPEVSGMKLDMGPDPTLAYF